MRSSMSLSFVESHVCVGVPSFVSVRFMSSMVPVARLRTGRSSFVSKTLMFAIEVTCKYDVVPPQTEPLNDFS